jgi:hypothetical protein
MPAGVQVRTTQALQSAWPVLHAQHSPSMFEYMFWSILLACSCVLTFKLLILHVCAAGC